MRRPARCLSPSRPAPSPRAPSPLAWALVAGLTAITGSAAAEQVPTAPGQTMEVAPIDGYCVLDESRPVEAEFIKTIRATVGSAMRVALAFGDCTELVELRAGERQILDNFGQILLLANAEGVVQQTDDSKATYLDSVAKQLTFPPGRIEDIAANGEAQMKATGKDVPAPIVAVLDHDDQAFYIGTAKLQVDGKRRTVIAGLAAITLVRRASVTINLFSAYDGSQKTGAAVLTNLTRRLKAGVEDLQFVNEDPAAPPAPLPVPSRNEWQAMGSTALIGGAIGGILGGIGALFVVWRRRRRHARAGGAATPVPESAPGN